ncbi:MAG TPA: hypothetical protein VKW08_17325 [Xanthobacteraceae bacterium]|nr:hypothetical protein [Xanthobacteraceae bacterium]
MTKRAPSTLLLIAQVIAFAGIAPNIAHAQESGSAESTLWGSMLKGLGVGGENNIEYRERPPLVVPQTRDLPPPQPRGSARNNPNWPADPKSAGAGRQGTQVRDLDKIPVEVGANPARDPTLPPPSQPAKSNSLFGSLFSSSNKENVTPPTPTRRSLTDPPLDFQVPSPSQPYGEETKSTPAKPATAENALASAPGTPAGANPSVGAPGQ